MRNFLVKSIDEETVIYADEVKNTNAIGEKEFLKKWSGIALRGIVKEKSGEKDFLQNKMGYFLKNLRYPLFFLILCFSIFSLLENMPLIFGIIAITKITGLCVTLMLLTQSLEIKNSLLDRVCSVTGENNCKNIIKSEAGKITKWLSWTELGLFYFAGTVLLLLFNPQSLAILTFLNLLCLPFSIYLLLYQYKHKTWCVLCCTVQALIFAEFIIDIFANTFQYKMEGYNYISILITLCLPVLIWSIIKPLILKASQVPSLKYYLNMFKYDSQIFNSILSVQFRYSPDENLPMLEFGNLISDNVIMLITNPSCQSCISAHQNIFNWLETRQDFKVQIVFATSNQNPDSREIANHITALYHKQGIETAEHAMNDWFNGYSNRRDEWIKLYPVDSLELMNNLTDIQEAWCNRNGLYFTPAIFIDGYPLPEQYRVEDLKYVVG